MQSIAAHFDGTVIVPDEPLQLPVGQPLRVHVELAKDAAPRYADLMQFAADLPDAPPDLSRQHDRPTGPFPALLKAAESSLGFWDNPLDDEDWNNA
jgi:hypothetical protein